MLIRCASNAQVLRIPNTTTFLKPRSSAALRAFLKYDEFAGDGHLVRCASAARVRLLRR